MLQASEAGAHNAKVARSIASRAGKEKDSLSVLIVDECHAWLGVHAGGRLPLTWVPYVACRVACDTLRPLTLAQAAPSINS